MEAKELTKEMLVEAANDLNKVLELKPPVVTEFTSSLKGAPLKAAEKKFVDQLCKDLVEVATCADEKGKLLLQPTDTLQPVTVDVLETLGVEGIREKVGEKVTSPTKNKATKKSSPAAGAKKKEEAGKVGKPKPEARGDKNDWGHRLGSQGAKIDEAVKKAVAKGKALETEALVKETGLSKARVVGHLKHLKEKKLIKE